MKKKYIMYGLFYYMTSVHALPSGFTYLKDPRIIYSINYATPYNFVGRRVSGYFQQYCIMTQQAAKALKEIQDELATRYKDHHLKIFDAYRPQDAVDCFQIWAANLLDQKTKPTYYPHVEKSGLIQEGYIGSPSSHSRGSAVDLTITVKQKNGSYKDLDMGTTFDFFDPTSSISSTKISAEAQKNRRLLKSIMERHGFIPYEKEWWHYRLNNEPFPTTYFNFPVG